MSKYEIINNEGICMIYSEEESAFFAGYNFMGGVNWVKIPDVNCGMGLVEAQQIVSDLEAADAPAEPWVEPSPEDIPTSEELAGEITDDQVRIVIEAARCWLMHLNYRGIADDALYNAIEAMEEE